LADGGTIFLDEIAETPLELQSVLLRVIEEKSITRIGGTKVRPIDVRIITATNKDLMREVNRGTFRKDLYYRLNVFVIHLVPLNEKRTTSRC
jgi:transcriptional regulator with PAS, ATPase and Fis domain